MINEEYKRGWGHKGRFLNRVTLSQSCRHSFHPIYEITIYVYNFLQQSSPIQSGAEQFSYEQCNSGTSQQSQQDLILTK